jgi:Bacterial protein of unknown function (DUF839)
MAWPVARILCGVALTTTLAVTNTPAEATRGAATGPSSSQSPYVLPSQSGVVTKSVLTVGDSVNLKPDGTPYRMVGIPDGLGAFDNGDGSFTVLMNHELGGNSGAVRAHGAIGAFVSKWTIRKDDLSVVAGEDLIKQVALWNIDAAAYRAPATGIVISRLCSADLPLPSALFNSATGNGYDGRIFLDGEEVAGGRAFAHLLNGTSYELPWMGKASWENILANPATGDKTVVAGLDDTSPLGQVYLYAGDKKSTGSPLERAGLTGGKLYGIKVAGFSEEEALTGPIPSGTGFRVYDFGDASAETAAQIEAESDEAGVTDFLRPEDGAWDPKRPSDFYFVTTATFGGNSRLWRLRFADPSNPAMGGVIDMLLEGTEDGSTGERYHMLDNMTINGRGQLVLQEDPGNQSYLARIWLYDIASDGLREVAHHDPARFAQPNPALTQDEESSGAIDVSTILGSGWYLLDVQAHYNPGDPELVEGGQLLAMHIPPGR